MSEEYVYRWVAEMVMGEPNTRHMNKMLHDGWVRCHYDDPYVAKLGTMTVDGSVVHLTEEGALTTGIGLYRRSLTMNNDQRWERERRNRAATDMHRIIAVANAELDSFIREVRSQNSMNAAKGWGPLFVEHVPYDGQLGVRNWKNALRRQP